MILRVVKTALKIASLIVLFGLGACGVDTDSRVAVPTDTASTVVEKDDQQPRYNILLILADDLGYDHYGFAGHPVVKTPSIDALSNRSVRFPAAYVSSVCRPTFATLLTLIVTPAMLALPEALSEFRDRLTAFRRSKVASSASI